MSTPKPIANKYPRAYAGLQAAIKVAGGQTKLAEALTQPGKLVRQGVVSNWVLRDGRCSHQYVLQVEKVTGISRHELRPDLYPDDTPVLSLVG